ncbi:hypothetical protein LB465_00700 [Salegentibacter sp. LM13S]|uniref:hypothetical protein n=1 Tax=Salegentibacter lacus TaxID=2873599 RepID=UPI001CCF1B9C|nr:hypothetical protein [Salegentibacter lacus]MBZ9629277.1 hypothetical protein [Salegentibacter lacus]
MVGKTNYIGFAYQFLQIARESINEMEKQGNYTSIWYDVPDHKNSKDDDNDWIEYEYKTRWNDMNVGVPILFNFYHGLELYMKGLLETQNLLPSTKNHDLGKLYKIISVNQDKFTKEIMTLLEKHLSIKSPFNDFFSHNCLTPDKFYHCLKYPEDLKGNQFKFTKIRGNEDEGLRKFLIIRDDCMKLKAAIKNWIKPKHA